MPVFQCSRGISAANPGDKAAIRALEFTETCPVPAHNSLRSHVSSGSVGMSMGPGTFPGLWNYVGGRHNGSSALRLPENQIGRNHFGTHLCETEAMQREIRLLCLPHVYFNRVWTSCVLLSCCRMCYFPRKRVNTIFPCREAMVCWIGRDSWHVSVVALSLCTDVGMQHNAGCWSKTEF